MKYEKNAKANWTAKWIWNKAETESKNVWLVFNKKILIENVLYIFAKRSYSVTVTIQYPIISSTINQIEQLQ